jgi:hypothetical protein
MRVVWQGTCNDDVDEREFEIVSSSFFSEWDE